MKSFDRKYYSQKNLEKKKHVFLEEWCLFERCLFERWSLLKGVSLDLCLRTYFCKRGSVKGIILISLLHEKTYSGIPHYGIFAMSNPSQPPLDRRCRRLRPLTDCHWRLVPGRPEWPCVVPWIWNLLRCHVGAMSASARRLDSLSPDTCVLLVSNPQPRHRSGHGCRPGPTRVMNHPGRMVSHESASSGIACVLLLWIAVVVSHGGFTVLFSYKEKATIQMIQQCGFYEAATLVGEDLLVHVYSLELLDKVTDRTKASSQGQLHVIRARTKEVWEINSEHAVATSYRRTDEILTKIVQK